MTICFRVAAVTAVLALWPAQAGAGGADPLRLPGTPPKPAAEGGKPASGPSDTPPGAGTGMSDAQKYCQNIAAAAADARFAWQSKKLAEVEGQIKQRVTELEAKQAEVKDILTRYDDAVKHAKAGLVDIYGRMRPETAAAQLSALDDAAAAAILAQLSAQKASAILNEIAPDRAVKLVTTISGLMAPADGKKS